MVHQNRELVSFCQENKITVTAFAPLGSPGRFQFKSTVVFPKDDDTKTVTSILSSPEVRLCEVVLREVNVESTCVCNTPALPQGIVLDAIPPASVSASGSEMFLDFEELVHPGTGILWSPKFNFLPTI